MYIALHCIALLYITLQYLKQEKRKPADFVFRNQSMAHSAHSLYHLSTVMIPIMRNVYHQSMMKFSGYLEKMEVYFE